eukprot:1021454-Amphidinium_carterae.2
MEVLVDGVSKLLAYGLQHELQVRDCALHEALATVKAHESKLGYHFSECRSIGGTSDTATTILETVWSGAHGIVRR